jgi:hypothetical protein
VRRYAAAVSAGSPVVLHEPTFAIVLSAVASVGAAAAAIAAWRAVFQARQLQQEATKANEIPALLDFVREYRRYERARRYILRKLRKQHPPVRVADLPRKPLEHALDVCHYLDHLGFLVDQRLVDPIAVAGFMGDSMLRCWDELLPYIDAERKARDGPYAQYFEDLAVRVKAIGPREAHKGLRTFSANYEPPSPIRPNVANRLGLPKWRADEAYVSTVRRWRESRHAR